MNTINTDIWKCNLSEKDIVGNFPKGFWRDVLQSFSYSNFTQENTDQILWYNSLIKIDGKVFFWHKQFKKGLMKISQICIEGKTYRG